MNADDLKSKQTYSFMALRKTVGWIGILLPFTLMFGVLIFFNDNTIYKSISLYYHSPMRDIFVGALCAIGLFLLYYKGYDKWDNLTASIAGFFAICVAWFPTVKSGPYNLAAVIHFVSATIFFLTLAYISLFLFTKKRTTPTRQKLSRNIIYKTCGIVMLACLLAIFIYFIIMQEAFGNTRFIFWAETVALIAFGVSWLTKGGTLYPDK